MKIWNPILAFLMFYTATIVPYHIAFLAKDGEAVVKDAWYYIIRILDALF